MTTLPSIHHIDLDGLKFAGAIVTILGIASAAIAVLLLVPLGLTERIVVIGFWIWLSWFLLRNGLPPSKLLISVSDNKIGLQNVLATRWFSIEESQLIASNNGGYSLDLDNRTISLPEHAGIEILQMFETNETEEAT